MYVFSKEILGEGGLLTSLQEFKTTLYCKLMLLQKTRQHYKAIAYSSHRGQLVYILSHLQNYYASTQVTRYYAQQGEEEQWKLV